METHMSARQEEMLVRGREELLRRDADYARRFHEAASRSEAFRREYHDQAEFYRRLVVNSNYPLSQWEKEQEEMKRATDGKWFEQDGRRAVTIRRMMSDQAGRREGTPYLESMSATFKGWGIFGMVVSSIVSICITFGGHGITHLDNGLAVLILWGITAFLWAQHGRYMRKTYVNKSILVDAERITKNCPSELFDVVRRGVENTRTVFDQCSVKLGRKTGDLAVQADSVLRALAEATADLSQMLSIKGRNGLVPEATGRMAEAMEASRQALDLRIAATRTRITDLDAGLAMLAQASFNIGDNNVGNDSVINEVLGTTKALLDVGNVTGPHLSSETREDAKWPHPTQTA